MQFNKKVDIYINFFPFTFIYGQKNTSINFNTSNSFIQSNVIRTILIESDNIWLGSRDHGLILFKDGKFENFNPGNSSIPHENIYSLALDSLQNIWIGTFGGGIAKYYYPDNHWDVFNSTNSELTFDWIYSISIDYENNKWIGTGGSGLFMFNDSAWVNYNSTNSELPTYKVPTVYTNGSGKKWIGTLRGLLSIDENKWNWYNNTLNIPEVSIYSILVQSDTTIWIGFKKRGLGKLRGKDFSILTAQNSMLPSNSIYSLVEDSEGNIWVGTFGKGIAKIDSGKISIFNSYNSEIQDDFIFDIKIDKNNNKYLATYSKGLIVFNENGIVK